MEDATAVAEMRWAMQFVLGVRRIKGEMDIPPGQPIPVLLQNLSAQDLPWPRPAATLLLFHARGILSKIHPGEELLYSIPMPDNEACNRCRRFSIGTTDRRKQ